MIKDEVKNQKNFNDDLKVEIKNKITLTDIKENPDLLNGLSIQKLKTLKENIQSKNKEYEKELARYRQHFN